MYKKKLAKIIDESKGILKEHKLCDDCLGRMFAGKLRILSHKRLGSMIRKKLNQKPPMSCYICKNLMRDQDVYLGKMISISQEYQFSTFLIGAILKPSILDRDDFVRSKFKLRGIISIKSAVTREMGKLFSRKTNSRVDYQNPDVIFTIDFKKDEYEIKSKSLLLKGRYVKKIRGMPQKQKPCEKCAGKGCFACNFHGIREFNSVEGKIAKYLIEKFGAMIAKITWIGSEDESSLVMGKGRPFFVKLTNPHKRKILLPRKIDLDGISIRELRPITKIPSEPVKFHTMVTMEIEAEKEIESDKLIQLQKLSGKPIVIYENSGHKGKKTIYDISVERKSDKSFKIIMDSEGGIPFKRFVTGQKIEPSVSSVLETNCKCKLFDFQKIIVTNRVFNHYSN